MGKQSRNNANCDDSEVENDENLVTDSEDCPNNLLLAKILEVGEPSKVKHMVSFEEGEKKLVSPSDSGVPTYDSHGVPRIFIVLEEGEILDHFLAGKLDAKNKLG